MAKDTSGQVLVMDGSTLDERARFSGRHFGEGAEIRFTSEDEYFVDATWSGRLMVRETESGRILHEEPGGGITSLACTPDRQTWIYLRWKLKSSDPPGPGEGIYVRHWPFNGDPGYVIAPGPFPKAVAISPDGNRIAVTGDNALDDDAGGVRAPRGSLAKTAGVFDLPRPGGTGSAMAWSPDGMMLARVSRGRVCVHDAGLGELRAHDMPFPCDIEFSPAGDLLALGGWSRARVVISCVAG